MNRDYCYTTEVVAHECMSIVNPRTSAGDIIDGEITLHKNLAGHMISRFRFLGKEPKPETKNQELNYGTKDK